MLAQMVGLKIANEFTTTPGPRKVSEGDFSGEQFLHDVLRPKYIAVREANGSLQIDLDDVAGYPTSFLEEAFGGLAREFGWAEVDRRIELVCNDEPYVAEEIRRYIREAVPSR